MTIVYTDPALNTVDEALLAYINHLRFQHSMDQHMLQRGPDDRCLARFEEVRAKNTELETKNRDLRTALDAVALAQNPKIAELEAQLKAERERSADLTNQLNAKRFDFDVVAYGKRLVDWNIGTFGKESFADFHERACRLLEEALETAQAMGVTNIMADRIKSRVYSRPPGKPEQELGGVAICWFVLVGALGLNPTQIMDEAERDIWVRQDEIREKQKAKAAEGVSHDLSLPFGYKLRPSEDQLAREKRTTRMSNADGDAAIVAGREALEAHKRLTGQLGRGE